MKAQQHLIWVESAEEVGGWATYLQRRLGLWESFEEAGWTQELCWVVPRSVRRSPRLGEKTPLKSCHVRHPDHVLGTVRYLREEAERGGAHCRVVAGGWTCAQLLKAASFSWIYWADHCRSRMWSQVAREAEGKLWRKSLARWNAERCRRQEKEVLQKVSQVWVGHLDELKHFKRIESSSRGLWTPQSLRFPRSIPERPSESQPAAGARVFVCQGPLDWPPHLEALQWFLNTVWKDFHAAFPESELRVAGRGTLDGLHQSGQWPQGVSYWGEICNDEDLYLLFEGAHAAIAPVFWGEASQEAILEAARMGRSTLTTSLAMGPACATFAQDLVSADSPAEWQSLLRSVSALEWHERGQRVREQARRAWGWERVVLAVGQSLDSPEKKVSGLGCASPELSS